MSLRQYLQRLEFIDYLTRRKATGNLESFASKNRLSKNGLLNVLREMKEMGFPIKYSRNLNSYYYEKDGRMIKTLFIEDSNVLTREDMRQIENKNVDNICFSEITVFEVCEKT